MKYQQHFLRFPSLDSFTVLVLSTIFYLVPEDFSIVELFLDFFESSTF